MDLSWNEMKTNVLKTRDARFSYLTFRKFLNKKKGRKASLTFCFFCFHEFVFCFKISRCLNHKNEIRFLLNLFDICIKIFFKLGVSSLQNNSFFSFRSFQFRNNWMLQAIGSWEML